MRGQIRVSVVLLAATFFVGQATLVSAATNKQLKRLDKQAGKSLARGDLDAALEAYREILDATDPGDAWRSNALYTDLISRLSSTPADMEGAAPLLGELQDSFSRHPQSREIAVVSGLIAALSESETERMKVAEELARQAEESAPEPVEEPVEVCSEARSLEKKLGKLRAELETTRSELAKKDAALAKLKEALVSGG